MRHLIAFPCAGATLAGTLDTGARTTGLLVVSGGNEVRGGAHRGMAELARTLAAEGTPVFRYDRRGTGDSDGENLGFAGAADDLHAAAAAFRAAQPHVTRLVAFGNCDAATLLALDGASASIDALILANPWTGDEADDLPPAAAIRAGYARQLRDPAEWRRALRGGVDLAKLLRGLLKLARTGAKRPPLAGRLTAALATWDRRATIILAEDDATARAFTHAARARPLRTITIPTASHSFARSADTDALHRAIRAVLED